MRGRIGKKDGEAMLMTIGRSIGAAFKGVKKL